MNSHIRIGDDLVEDAILTDVEVVDEINQHSRCVICLRQTPDVRPNVEQFLGQPVEVTTIDQDGTPSVAFSGFILEAQLEYEISGSFVARLSAISNSYRLDVTPQETYWRQKKLMDVAETAAGRSGVPIDVKCQSNLASRNYLQWGETDFQFLSRISDDYEAWIRTTPAGLEICDSFGAGPPLQWCTEGGLLSFSVEGELGASGFGGTHHSAHTAVSNRIDVEDSPDFTSASAGLSAAVVEGCRHMPAAQLTVDGRAATDSEYEQVLKDEHRRSVGSGVLATGISRVDKVRAGSTVEVEGNLDARGSYGVVRVIHRWSPSGYENEFWCTSWKKFRSPRRPEGAKIHGVASARVVDHNDPENMGRLQVRYDWQDGATSWARMMTPHAGADRGFLFLPEIGDEVLVAFEQGDPERPYIVGSLWNGVDTAPRDEFWGGDIANNDVKRIVTKSGHRIQLSDKEGQEAITIATPRKLKLGLLEKADETKRPMILLNAEDGDIVCSAPNGRIHFRSHYFSREIGDGPVTTPPPAKPSEAPPKPAPPLTPAQRQRERAKARLGPKDPLMPRWADTKYGSGPWYPSSKEHSLDSYSGWNELIRKGKVTVAGKRIISAVSPNEGSLDALQSYDDQVVSLGAMQKTVNRKGEGELPKQIDKFKKEHPEEYENLFAKQGWTVRRDEIIAMSKKKGGAAIKKLSEPRLYYANPNDPNAVPITGKALKDLICDKANPEQYKKILAPLRQAGQNSIFQEQQILDFQERLTAAMAQSPAGYDQPISDFVKSQRGAALVLDQSVNRPNNVAKDMGKSLDQFFEKRPEADKDPGAWTSGERNQYEREILGNYESNRRMIEADTRAVRIDADGRLDQLDYPGNSPAT